MDERVYFNFRFVVCCFCKPNFGRTVYFSSRYLSLLAAEEAHNIKFRSDSNVSLPAANFFHSFAHSKFPSRATHSNPNISSGISFEQKLFCERKKMVRVATYVRIKVSMKRGHRFCAYRHFNPLRHVRFDHLTANQGRSPRRNPSGRSFAFIISFHLRRPRTILRCCCRGGETCRLWRVNLIK